MLETPCPPGQIRGSQRVLGIAAQLALAVPLSVTEYGVTFTHGRPVTFKYVRNTEKAPHFGSRFQQDIEPAGIYILHIPDTGDLPKNWVQGEITLRSPFLILFNTAGGYYDQNSWKAQLSRIFKGKRGRGLSHALIKSGYDSIVTLETKKGKPTGTREIIKL